MPEEQTIHPHCYKSLKARRSQSMYFTKN